MMKKSDKLRLKSNPLLVSAKAKALLGNDTQLYISTHKDKKYMLRTPEDKWVHFGDINSEDWTFHQDDERLARFHQRNAKWKTAPKWSPAWLSYHLLW